MPQFRKKPVVVEAVRWTNAPHGELAEIMRLAADNLTARTITFAADGTADLIIKTLEGDMRATVGDWIVRGVQGEVYPCKPDIFDLTYEPVPEEER